MNDNLGELLKKLGEACRGINGTQKKQEQPAQEKTSADFSALKPKPKNIVQNKSAVQKPTPPSKDAIIEMIRRHNQKSFEIDKSHKDKP